MAYLGEVKLAAGTNNAGDVDIASALPAGDNNIGNVDVVTLPRQTAVAVSTGDTHAPADNAEAKITYSAAGAGISHVVTGLAWSLDADPTSDPLPLLTLEDGDAVKVFQVSVTSKGPGFFVFPQPKKGTANTAMVIRLTAGGSGVGGKVSALNHWTE